MAPDQLVAALQQLQQKTKERLWSKQRHNMAGVVEGFPFSLELIKLSDALEVIQSLFADELSALLGRIREEPHEGRSPDGDGHEKGVVVGREARTPERPTVGSNDGTDFKGRAGKPLAVRPSLSATSSVSPIVEALAPAAGSEPADLHTMPPLGADAPTDEKHWSATFHTGFGAKIWYDGRPMFQVISGVQDSCVTAEDPKPQWLKCVEAVVDTMNASVPHKDDWLTTSDPRVVSVMGSVPECAANGCQFRKTSGYRPGEKADFPLEPPIGSQLSFVLSINRPAGEPLVIIRPHGTLEYGADYTPDAAARVFWEAMASAMPKLQAPSSAPPQAPAGRLQAIYDTCGITFATYQAIDIDGGTKVICRLCAKGNGQPHAADCGVGRFEAALAKLQAPAGWQPIETAPKDGTNVLLGWPKMVMGGYWADWRGRKSWVTARGEYSGENAPLCWMPMPTPPLSPPVPETP